MELTRLKYQYSEVDGDNGVHRTEQKQCAPSRVILRVGADILCVTLIMVPVIVFRFGVYPFRRGFYCDDESITHPYRDSTISTAVLIIVGLGLPIIPMLIGEYFYLRLELQPDGTRETSEYKYPPVPAYVVLVYKTVGVFLFGGAVTQCATDIMKYSIGRLRPHFFDVCKPTWDTFNCTDIYGRYIYVEQDVCTGDSDLIKEARLSHPSGHASFSAYCMVYLALYIQSRVPHRFSALLKHLLQAILLYMAIYCSLSRVSDYKHHWSDVLGGGILGAVIALLIAFFVSELFRRPQLLSLAEDISLLAKKSLAKTDNGYGSGLSGEIMTSNSTVPVDTSSGDVKLQQMS